MYCLFVQITAKLHKFNNLGVDIILDCIILEVGVGGSPFRTYVPGFFRPVEPCPASFFRYAVIIDNSPCFECTASTKIKRPLTSPSNNRTGFPLFFLGDSITFLGLLITSERLKISSFLRIFAFNRNLLHYWFRH